MELRNLSELLLKYKNLYTLFSFLLLQMMPHRNEGGGYSETGTKFREIYAEWSLIFECVQFFEACFLILVLLKLTNRAHCITLQSCLSIWGKMS